jgi:hypothetical protein
VSKTKEAIEPILPLVVEEVSAEWADSMALGLPSMYSNGESFAEVCMSLGITKAQYKECCKLSDRFSAADQYSQVVHEARWMKTGREGAAGKRINGAIFNHTMNNRYGWSNNGGTDDGSKGRTLNLGIVFVGSSDKVGVGSSASAGEVIQGAIETAMRIGVSNESDISDGEFEDI